MEGSLVGTTSKRVEADVSIGGALWQLKGRPYLLKNTHVIAELREERISTLLIDSNERLTFEAGPGQRLPDM
jgi:hypothetical protein